MTFYNWLKKQDKRDDPVGDLAVDAQRDPTFPRAATSKEQVIEYIYRKNLSIGMYPLVKDAIKEAWKEYEKQN